MPAVAPAPIWDGQQDWSDRMSAVERLEDGLEAGFGETPPPHDHELLEDPASIEAALTPSGAKRSARLRPLLALAPYVARYRGRAFLALISLTVAAITTLVVPVAVRRMIDFGFTPEAVVSAARKEIAKAKGQA